MNSEEIARLANVSRSTVSRVVNRYSNVPETTRKKVQDIIDQYGYTPNVSARNLAGKTNRIIGLFIADIVDANSVDQCVGVDSPYNAKLLAAIISQCKQRGYLVLVNTVSNEQECDEMEIHFQNRMLFGGIFVGFPYGMEALDRIAMKDENNIVLIDQKRIDASIENSVKLVNTDNVYGGYLACKYLLDLGHKRIAFIKGDYRLSSIERFEGYQKALAEYGVDYDEDLVGYGAYREDVAYECTKEMLEKSSPTAFFAANDIMGLGVAKALNEHKLSIPNDVSLIGFDNIKMAELLQLDMTSMDVSIETIAKEATQLLFDKHTQKCVMCKPVLIEGMTCKKR